MISTAGIPSQWYFKLSLKLPWKISVIALPKPHPGHQVTPMLARGQKVKWISPGCNAGFAIARKINAAIQKNSSKGKRINHFGFPLLNFRVINGGIVTD